MARNGNSNCLAEGPIQQCLRNQRQDLQYYIDAQSQLTQQLIANRRQRQEEAQKLSAHDDLKKAIPGASIGDAKYTLAVIESLKKSREAPKFKNFADFVARNIMEKLRDKAKEDWRKFNRDTRAGDAIVDYEDLLREYSIEKLNELKSGALFRGPLHIKTLEEEFRKLVEERRQSEIYKSRGKNWLNQPKSIAKFQEEQAIEDESKRLLKTIPGQAELPNPTISGVFSCCCARQKPSMQRE